jgi:Skp family chaperone for outer membrane proteins
MLSVMRFLGLFLLAVAVSAVGPARAQAQAPAAKLSMIAVVDIPYIMQNAAASKAVRTQLDKDNAGYKTDFSKRDGDLRNAYQDMQSQLGLLGPDAQRDRRVAFEQRAADFEREVDFRRRDMANRQNNALKKIDEGLKSVLLDIAAERKLTMILQKDAAAFYDTDMDLTNEVMKRLDAKLPTVKVDPPAPLPKGPAPLAGQAPKAPQAPKGQ